MDFACPGGRAGFCIVPVNFKVPKFGVRHQHTVINEGGTNAGPQGDNGDEPHLVSPLPVGGFGKTCSIGIINAVDSS